MPKTCPFDAQIESVKGTLDDMKVDFYKNNVSVDGSTQGTSQDNTPTVRLIETLRPTHGSQHLDNSKMTAVKQPFTALLPGADLRDGEFEQTFTHKADISGVARAVTQVRINPGSTVLVPTKMITDFRGICLLDNHPRNVDRNIKISDGLIDSNNSLYYIPVCNLGLQPITIARLTRLGQLTPVDSDDYILDPEVINKTVKSREKVPCSEEHQISTVYSNDIYKAKADLSPLLKFNPKLSEEQLNKI